MIWGRVDDMDIVTVTHIFVYFVGVWEHEPVHARGGGHQDEYVTVGLMDADFTQDGRPLEADTEMIP